MLNEDPHALNGWTGGSRSASEIVSPTPQRCQQWANLIHDQVLQSLGLCALQADLCRRLWETGQEAQALAELQGVGEELDVAIEVLRRVQSELLAAAKT